MPLDEKIQPSGERQPIENKEDIKDYQRGVSQESLEDLRSEFVSIGGIVTTLPDISEVRDWTMVSILTKDISGEDVLELWLMSDGKWWSLNDYRATPSHASGNIDQYDTTSTVTLGTPDAIVVVTADWTIGHIDRLGYNNAGVFTVEIAGEYQIIWSLSFTSSIANKDFEGGILINGLSAQSGWAHRRISTASDTGSMGASTIEDLRKGDTISLGVVGETAPATGNLIVQHASFTIHRIR